MAILIINLSSARHLDNLIIDHELIYASPRLIDNVSKLEMYCSYTPDCTALIKKVNHMCGLSVDLVISYVDVFGFASFLPRFDHCEVPMLAILGDTHHGFGSISKVHKYLTRSKIKYIALKQSKGQQEIFSDLGYEVFCFGTYIVDPRYIEPTTSPAPYIAAYGSNSDYHFRRNHIIYKLHELGLPIWTSRVPRNDMFKVYNEASAVLNVPLNSDVNYRFHEVSASGGLLLTENLSPISRKNEYQIAGTDYLEYKNIPELADLCRLALSKDSRLISVKSSSYSSLRTNILKVATEFTGYLVKIIRTPLANSQSSINENIHHELLRSFEIYQEINRKNTISPHFQSCDVSFPRAWLNSFNIYNYS